MEDIPNYSKIEKNQKRLLNQGFSDNLIFHVSQHIGLMKNFDIKAALKRLKNNENQIISLGSQNFNLSYQPWLLQLKYHTNENLSSKVEYNHNKYRISLKANQEDCERNYSASIKYTDSEINSKLALRSTKLIDLWVVKPSGMYGVGFKIGYNYGLKQFLNKSIALWMSNTKSSVALKYLIKTKDSQLKESFAAYASNKLSNSLECAASVKLLENLSADLKFCFIYDVSEDRTIKLRARSNGVLGFNLSQKLNEFLKFSAWYQFSINEISNKSEPVSNIGFKLEITRQYIDINPQENKQISSTFIQ